MTTIETSIEKMSLGSLVEYLGASGCYILDRERTRESTDTLLCEHKIDMPIDRLRHLLQLSTLRDDYEQVDQLTLLIRLYNHNFVWIVPPSFIVSKFIHAASLSKYPTVETDSQIITYEGDIPQFALENIGKAQQLGTQFFTIHSNLPLATNYRKNDPIVIAWTANPRLRLDKRFSPGFYTTRHAYAVIIAAWDYDKEILLRPAGKGYSE